MSKTLTCTGHPHWFYLCFKILSFYQDFDYFPTNDTALHPVCLHQWFCVRFSSLLWRWLLAWWKKLGSWGFRNAAAPAFLPFLVTVSLSGVVPYSIPAWEKEVQQMARPFWVSASWPHTISLLEFWFWRGVSDPVFFVCNSWGLDFQWPEGIACPGGDFWFDKCAYLSCFYPTDLFSI